MKKIVSLCLIIVFVLIGATEIFAADFSTQVSNQFLFNASDREKDRVKNVYDAQSNEIWRDFYKNQRYEWTVYNHADTKFDFDNAYSTYGILLDDFYNKEDSYAELYDIIRYAQRNEFDLLLTENPQWEIPVYFGDHYVTTTYMDTLDRLVVPNNTQGNDYTTLNFLSEIRKIKSIAGIENIELLKFVCHRPALIYVYIKADGKDYALPYDTGNLALYFRNAERISANFNEIEYGKLYTVEELYTLMLKEIDECADAMAMNKVFYFDYAGIGGIPYLMHEYDAPDENMYATAGEMAEKLQKLGLLKGDGDGLAIHNTLTRAEGITMLLRLIGLEQEAAQAADESVFTDVSAEHWARNNIVYAYEKGLVKGTSESTFSPEEKLSGLQFMVMLLRAMGYDNYENEVLSLENANDIAQKVGFNTKFYSIIELKRGHMAEMVSKALNVTQANGKTVAETLLQNGVITNEQFSYIDSPDFYSAPYVAKEEGFKIEGYPPFPELPQKHYAVYKEATRDSRTEVAFFDIADEKGDETLIYNGEALTLSENERYTNSVKYVLSGTVWLKFEEGYPAISNYASEILASDLPVLKNGQLLEIAQTPESDKTEQIGIEAEISTGATLNYKWTFPSEYQFIKADAYETRVELIFDDGTTQPVSSYSYTCTSVKEEDMVQWMTENELNRPVALRIAYFYEKAPEREYVLKIDLSNITVTQEGTAPEPGQYVQENKELWKARKITLGGWDIFEPTCYYVLIGREIGRANGLVCKTYFKPQQASNTYVASQYEIFGVYCVDDIRLQEITVSGNYGEGFVINITPESEKAFEFAKAE